MPRTDTEIVDWLERMHTRHTNVDVTRMLDTYKVELTYDHLVVLEFHGTTLRDAYSEAMAFENNPIIRNFVKA